MRAIKADEFEQYKQALITELSQCPQMINEKVGPLRNDLDRENFTFNTPEKLIEALKPFTVEQIAASLNKKLAPQALAVLSQISGNHHGKADRGVLSAEKFRWLRKTLLRRLHHESGYAAYV
ncbi:MAG: hypothetical protein ACR5LD_01610 [Symbiopectobacterium sp.]